MTFLQFQHEIQNTNPTLYNALIQSLIEVKLDKKLFNFILQIEKLTLDLNVQEFDISYCWLYSFLYGLENCHPENIQYTISKNNSQAFPLLHIVYRNKTNSILLTETNPIDIQSNIYEYLREI